MKAEVRDDMGGGKRRGLVALRGLRAGELVDDAGEEAAAAVVLPDQIAKRCHVTLLPAEKLLRCSKSKFARYRSREQQVADWKNGYRQECAALQRWCAKMGNRLPPTLVRLCCRLTWMAEKDADLRANLADLPDHFDQYADEERQELLLMARGAYSYLACADKDDRDPWAPANPARVAELAHRLAQLRANAHTVVNADQQPLAVALFAKRGRLVNHAHEPNAALVFGLSKDARPRLRLVASRPIAEGDEITISYVDPVDSWLARQTQLELQYCLPRVPRTELESKELRVQLLLARDAGHEPVQFALHRGRVIIGVDQDSFSEETAGEDVLDRLRRQAAGGAVRQGRVKLALDEDALDSDQDESGPGSPFDELVALIRDQTAIPSNRALCTAAGLGAMSAVAVLAQRRMHADIEQGDFEHALTCANIATPALERSHEACSPALATHYATLAKLNNYFAPDEQRTVECARRAVDLYAQVYGGDSVPRLGDQIDAKATVSYLRDVLRTMHT